MHVGVAIFATDYSIPIDELARETESRGFESLWVPEHTHIPTSRRTPWPGGDVEVTRIILLLPSKGRETILPLLDQYTTFLR